MICPYCENDDPALLEVTDRGCLYCAVCARVTVRGAAARLPRRVAAAGGEARLGRPAAGSHTGSEPAPVRRLCGAFPE